MFFILSGLLIPVIELCEPQFLKLIGIGPCWIVLWLLPWSLEAGTLNAIVAAIFYGLILDSIHIGNVTQIPALIALAFFWGSLGRRSSPIQRSFTLGFLAWLGTCFFGLTLWIQIFLKNGYLTENLFNEWAVGVLLTQSIITGFLAPMICALLISILRGRHIL